MDNSNEQSSCTVTYQSSSQSATVEPNGATVPTPTTLKFEPEYAVEDGVAHTFNGTLFVPTPDEFERLDRLAAIKDGVKQIVAEVSFAEPPRVVRAVPYCHGFSNQDGEAPRVKISAKEMIRLAATKSNGH